LPFKIVLVNYLPRNTVFSNCKVEQTTQSVRCKL